MSTCKEIHFFDSVHLGDKDRWRRFRLRQFCRYVENQCNDTIDFHCLQWFAKAALVETIDDKWYASLFADVGKSTLTGESTPAYALLPLAGVRHVHELMPRAKIIFIMRNPVDRSWSGALHSLRGKKIDGEVGSYQEFCRIIDSDQNRLRSDYRRTIRNWEAVFPRDQILYLFYDDLQQNKLGLLRTVCQFLQIDYHEQHFPQFQRQVNVSASVPMDDFMRRYIASRCYDQIVWLEHRFGRHAVTWRAAAEESRAA